MMKQTVKRLESAGRRFLSDTVLSRFSPERIVSRVPPGADLSRILLMRWDAIGDMMVCLPWFRKLLEVFPDAVTGIVVSKRNLQVLRHEKAFPRILYDSDPRRYVMSLMEARAFGPDAVVDTRMHYDSATSFIYGAFSGAEWMLSADNRDRRLPFSVRVPMPRERLHNADTTRILLEGLGRDIDDRNLDRCVRLSREEEMFADAFWRSAGLRLRGRAVGLNMSARDPHKAWPLRNMEKLCDELTARGLSVALLSMPSVAGDAKAIASRNTSVSAVPPCPTVLHAAAVMRDLAMFISPDTGLVHVASSYQIPTVGLYRRNEEHLPLWFPWRVESEVLADAEKVSNIPVADVVEAVERLAGRAGIPLPG